jgi:hypothetical protein
MKDAGLIYRGSEIKNLDILDRIPGDARCSEAAFIFAGLCKR